MDKIKVGIIGPGNIGLDLVKKLQRSDWLDPVAIVNVRESEGLQKARNLGLEGYSTGVKALIDRGDIQVVFDCTSATAHEVHAPLLKDAGIFTLDLTPAAVGPYLVPAVNLTADTFAEPNLNMVTCAGQATVPIVAAINQVADVSYAEVISSISSLSAGAGTRANIDEFTVTTRKALVDIGGADEGKVIIILNPAEPPIFMRNTIHTKVRDGDLEKIVKAVEDMVEKMKKYVPGYKILLGPIMKDDIVTTMIQVEGLGDYLPVYSGNLDIITAAAVETAEKYAQFLSGGVV